MKLPTVEAVNDVRIARFKQRITDTIAQDDLVPFQQLIEQYEQEHNVPALEIAAALARIAQGDRPLLLAPPPKREYERRESAPREPRERDAERRPPHERKPREAREGAPRSFDSRPPRPHNAPEPGKRTYRIEVGHEHGVKPGNIVGAIANEAGLESGFIGRVSIRDNYSLIDLPEGMPKEVFEHLKKVWVSQQQLRIAEWDGTESGGGDGAPPARKTGPRPGGFRSRPGGGKPPRRK
jgi:ATP-dependent RNA helicase DeaD